jgi:hypothetical protein
MRPLYLLVLAINTLGILQGCQQQPLPISAETILQPSKGGDFRGVRLGDKPKLIKRQEESSSVYSMPDELIYRFNPQEADSTWYEISYSFNEDGLNNISLDVYAQNAELQDNLFGDFVSYYTERFGISKKSTSHQQWRGLTVQGRYVTVSLLRDSAGSKPNHIRLVFNETKS